MPNYKYRATAMSGKTVRGNLVASDPEALLNELKKQDLFLLDYTQTNKTSFGSKLKPKELTDFCRQLGSLLDAGVSVIQSFNIISNRASISKFARKSFSDITTDLKHGKALSEAMADQGKVFPELLISMVRAGEASGKIGDTFLSMGQHFQKQQRIKSQVKGALAYPIVLMILLSLPCVLGFNVWSGFQPFGAGSNVLDLEDFLVSNIWLPLGSLVYLLFCTSRCGWGWKNFKEEANEGGGLKVKDNIRFYVSYILPVIVLIIFALGIKDKFF